MNWQTVIAVMRTLSEILNAGVAITGVSLLFYAFSFNLRVRVTRSFALMLLGVVVVFTAESLASIAGNPEDIEFWQRVKWLGIAILPATYLHFSDTVLALTGRPSRGKRMWLVRVAYLLAGASIVLLSFGMLIGPLETGTTLPYLRPTPATNLFLVYFAFVLALSLYNLGRALRRATTAAGRRRLGYLLAASLAPAVGAFPFLPYGSLLAENHPLIFWSLAFILNFIIGGMLILMAYTVAFFGVKLPDRIVRARLAKWIMRGPFTASLTLGVVTLARRSGNALGWNIEILVPILMTASILICEHLITLLSPLGERLMFYGKDREEIEALDRLESQLVTQNDLRQFQEMILTAMSDLLQAQGSYVIALDGGQSELVAAVGETRFSVLNGDGGIPEDLLQSVIPGDEGPRSFHWQGDTLFAIVDSESGPGELIGLLGVTAPSRSQMDPDQLHSLDLLVQRAGMALRDRRVQKQIFASLAILSPQVNLLEGLRAAGRYDREGVLASEESLEGEETVITWVKDALTHYWGGPRLTGSPLMRYRIVQEAVAEHEGNQANALRAILRRAIERVRPNGSGERRFTAEWILYNILDLKFLEGKKVREIAMRLAMSEADLYRKQRVAIEAVARAIEEMENKPPLEDTNLPK
jgi:hypothetical protein